MELTFDHVAKKVTIDIKTPSDSAVFVSNKDTTLWSEQSVEWDYTQVAPNGVDLEVSNLAAEFDYDAMLEERVAIGFMTSGYTKLCEFSNMEVIIDPSN